MEYDVFILIWDKMEDSYVLALQDGTSYELGSASDALIYFRNVLRMEEVGQRAIDCARNFYTAVAVWKEKRVFGAETEESIPEYKKLFGTTPDPVLVL